MIEVVELTKIDFYLSFFSVDKKTNFNGKKQLFTLQLAFKSAFTNIHISQGKLLVSNLCAKLGGRWGDFC